MEVHKNKHDAEIKYFASLCAADAKNKLPIERLDKQKRRRTTIPGAKKQSPKKSKSSSKGTKTKNDDEIDTELDEDQEETTGDDRDSVEERDENTELNKARWSGFREKVIADNIARGFEDPAVVSATQKRTSTATKCPRSAADRLKLKQQEEIAAADARRVHAITETVRLNNIERQKEWAQQQEEIVVPHQKAAEDAEQQLAELRRRLESAASVPSSSSSARYVPSYAYQGM